MLNDPSACAAPTLVRLALGHVARWATGLEWGRSRLGRCAESHRSDGSLGTGTQGMKALAPEPSDCTHAQAHRKVLCRAVRCAASRHPQLPRPNLAPEALNCNPRVDRHNLSGSSLCLGRGFGRMTAVRLEAQKATLATPLHGPVLRPTSRVPSLKAATCPTQTALFTRAAPVQRPKWPNPRPAAGPGPTSSQCGTSPSLRARRDGP